jgi:microcystin-dependent protein
MPAKFRLAAITAAVAMSGALSATPALAGPEPFVGELMLVGFNWCPRNFAKAEGQLLPIAQNTALFSLLGTTYGGDGRNTFALPDLRGRVPVGAGHGPGLAEIRIGEKAGAQQHTITSAQMPSHTHAATTAVNADVKLRATNQRADTAAPAGKVLGRTGGGGEVYHAGPVDQDMAGDAVQANVTATTTVNPAGGSQPLNIQDPYLGMTWCIALQGIYPSRP